MNIDEIIAFMGEISKDIDNNLNKACVLSSLNEPEEDINFGDPTQSIGDSGVLIKLFEENDNKLRTLMKKVSDDMEANHSTVNEKRSVINTLSKQLEEEQKELIHLEKTLQKLQNNADEYEKKTNNLISPQVNALKVYKLLTGITFDMRKDVCAGYIKLDDVWDVFDYDQSRFGNKEIQEKIFKLLSNLSGVE